LITVYRQDRSLRDETGHAPVTPPKRGSYAEERMEILRMERAKYNVDEIGNYKGGCKSAINLL
jgi:hypothetical protein